MRISKYILPTYATFVKCIAPSVMACHALLYIDVHMKTRLVECNTKKLLASSSSNLCFWKTIEVRTKFGKKQLYCSECRYPIIYPRMESIYCKGS